MYIGKNMIISESIEMIGILPALPEAEAHYSPEAATAYAAGILAMPETAFAEYVNDVRSEADDYRVGAATIRMLDSVDFECDRDLREAFKARADDLTRAVLDTISPIAGTPQPPQA